MLNNRTVSTVKDITEFDFVDNNFINIYNKENPVLSIGEHTYFMFNSIGNAHIPLIGYGRIIKDTFIKGMDKNYHIKLLKLHDTPATINEFIYGGDKTFRINGYGDNVTKRTLTKFNPKLIAKQPIFNVHCLFVRPDAAKISKLFSDYRAIILADLKKQIDELEKL